MNRYQSMLAQLAEKPFSSKDWIFEIKWDGIRAISYIRQTLSVESRNQKDLLRTFPELRELQSLTENTVIDGELVLIKEGEVDFQTIIRRFQTTSERAIQEMSMAYPISYIVFDILEVEGEPVTSSPLMERKHLLKENVREGKHIIISEYVEEKGELYYQSAMEKGLEGIIAKKKDSLYEQGRRSANWLKIKRFRICDCIIFGYTKGKGHRSGTFGALILGLYNANKIPTYVGKVGSGFSDEDLTILAQAFQQLQTESTPLRQLETSEEITWLRPVLICEVKYHAFTKDHKLRIPVFNGLRTDKSPEDCTFSQFD